MCAADLDHLDQAVRTQFFSRFLIRGKDRETGMVALTDVRTDRRYDVLDSHVCEVDRWQDGAIAMRIAQIDGLWRTVGVVHLYDRSCPADVSPDGPGEVHPEDLIRKPEVTQVSFYLRLLRDILGIEGRYHNTVRSVGDAA